VAVPRASGAFQRWLRPGLGATVLEARRRLRAGERVVGQADARRTVDAGGAYTVGARETRDQGVAEDVARELAARLEWPLPGAGAAAGVTRPPPARS